MLSPSHGSGVAGVVDHADLDAGQRRALLRAQRAQPLRHPSRAIAAARARHRRQRRRLRHAPRLDHVDAERVEALEQALRHRRAAARHGAQAREVEVLLLEHLEQAEQHRRHARRHRDAQVLDELREVARRRLRARVDLRGAHHRGAERQAPGVGVEHRHHREHAVALAQPEGVGHAPARSTAARARGGCRRRPWDGRWCPTCSTCRRPAFSSSAGHVDTTRARPPAGPRSDRRGSEPRVGQRAVAHHDERAHRLQLLRERLELRDQRVVDEQHARRRRG